MTPLKFLLWSVLLLAMGFAGGYGDGYRAGRIAELEYTKGLQDDAKAMQERASQHIKQTTKLMEEVMEQCRR